MEPQMMGPITGCEKYDGFVMALCPARNGIGEAGMGAAPDEMKGRGVPKRRRAQQRAAMRFLNTPRARARPVDDDLGAEHLEQHRHHEAHGLRRATRQRRAA